jgi:putative CocE/NonD family hydrolase
MPGWTSAGPLEQTDTRSDVLTFTSQPLDHPFEIAGNPSAVLWLGDDGPGDCCAKLLDVHPEGGATWVADGITRSSGGGEVTIDLGPVAYRFGQGHRLRLDVAASSFPQFDRMPREHLLRLFHGGRTPSRLLLP